jgi:hypothetical protein
MKKLIAVLLLFGQWAMAQSDAQTKTTPTVGLNSALSYKLLEPNQDLRKIILLLEERKKGALEDRSLVIGASLISIMDYQKSNTDSKFGYLMRHPTASNQIGTVVTEAVVHSFQLSFTGAVNNWLTIHSEILYNPEQSFGTGTITTLTRNQLQLRKAFIVLGDLSKSPVYGAVGKMDAPFGQVGSVSPFTNSTMWHAFGGLGYGAQLGFQKWNIHATVMAVQGGAQFRAMHTPVGNATNVPSKVNNMVADINYTINAGEDKQVVVGASYLDGSAYCQDFPVTHFSACENRNPAYSYYGRFLVNDSFLLMGSFAKTTELWPGTFNPNPPLNVFEASKVSSLNLGAKYSFNQDGNVLYSLSGEFSNYIAGPEGAPWERQNQLILGFSGLINHSSKLFVELFRTDGYVPLNFITGSAPFEPFPPGTTHSVNEANSHGIVIGGQITF